MRENHQVIAHWQVRSEMQQVDVRGEANGLARGGSGHRQGNLGLPPDQRKVAASGGGEW